MKIPREAISITGIIAIAVLEGFALHNGYNGTLMGLVIAAIAGIAGYELRGAKIERLIKDIKDVK